MGGVSSLQQSTYLIQCVQLSSRMENPKPFEVLKIGNIKRPPTTNISRKNLSNNTTSNPSKTTESSESSEVLFGKKLGLFTSTTPLPPRNCCRGTVAHHSRYKRPLTIISCDVQIVTRHIIPGEAQLRC